IFPRPNRACQRKMSIDQHRLQRARQFPEQCFASLLAIMHDHGAQPFVIGVVESDLAGPFLVLEEFLVALRQLRSFDQASVIGGGVVIRIDAIPAAVRVASLRNEDGAWGGSNCNSTSAGSRFTVVVTARSQLRCRALF